MFFHGYGVKQSAFLSKAFCLLFAVMLFLITLTPNAALAREVTVKLVWQFPETGWLEIEVRQGSYTLDYNDVSVSLTAGDRCQIGQSSMVDFLAVGDQFVILEKNKVKFTSQDQGVFRVREPEKDWISYRGNLSIVKENGCWKLYNSLEQEDYLKGVVPIEMSNAWAAKGFEALKAQAVAARTYLLKNINGGVITDSPNIHQAYLGRSVEGEASQAVTATTGEVLTDQDTGRPISIFYSSHNGGYMEAPQNVWQNQDAHYTSTPDPFSNGIGGYTDHWRFVIAADVLGEAFDLAPVRQVKLAKYVSGRVYRVVLQDWLGNEKLVSGGDFVRKFYPEGPLSNDSFLGRLFQVEYIMPVLQKNTPETPEISLTGNSLAGTSAEEGTGPLLSRIKSSNDGIAEKPGIYGVFVFNGRGWGHGVGMSQWGAYDMAMQGYSYQDILNYYYKNIDLVKME
ncbi:SpoIID/LytB domain-containing protein [Dehalobacter sp. TBBPA1]|uniref:SpoIID/LytB domain-containing protein n=1 Tax=Dehalobacter sp. TBBPA1 TaxID=3235037 RepID=UPI0034A1D0C3